MTETARPWPPRWLRPVPRNAFLIALGLWIVLRVWLATLPGYANDVDSYKNWGVWAAQHGMARAYEDDATTGARSPIDYPPLFVYVVAGIARFEQWRQGTPTPDIPYLAIKLPHVVFDLGLGLLLAWVVGRRRLWGLPGDGRGWGRVAALVYWFNPAVLFGSGYWGQPDGVHSSLIVLSLALLLGGRGAGAGAALSAAGLAKPLAAPLVPLLALAAWIRGGPRAFVTTGLGGLAAAALVFAPWWATGRLGPTLQRVLFDVEAMPYTTVNGHSIWWILRPWRLANQSWPAAFGLTPKTIALVAFSTVLILLLVALYRGRAKTETFGPRLFLTAGAVAAAFFALSTHMHENHLFTAIPLLAAVAGRSRTLFWTFVGLSLASFTNMALHDLDLPYRLPGVLSAPSPIVDRHLDRYYTWLQFVGSFLNAVAVVALATVTVVQAWRAGNPRREDVP